MTVAVLFDLEDTLVQTPWADLKHVIKFRHRTREKLIELEIPPAILEGTERATIMRNKASEYVEQNFNKTDTKKFQREMEKFLSQYELDSAEKSKLFPETIPTLETLRKLGTKIGLVTNTSAKAMDTIFQIHGLRDYFDVVVTRESVSKLKPDPEGILLAIRKLSARSFFMVGDLILDVLAAKNAKGTAIIVKREMGKAEQQDLTKSLPADLLEGIKKIQKERANLQADYIVKSLSEIPEIVQAEMRKSQC